MKDSIIQNKQYQDYDIICGSPYVQRHHVFGGPLRSKADADGLWVSLTRENHEYGGYPKIGITCDVHHCRKMMELLHIVGQLAWERNWILENEQDGDAARRAFTMRYGENYL